MKRIKYLIILAVVFASCKNEKVIYPDYDHTSVYFPLQYPLRTLVLGDSRSDNSLDKKLQFHIGVSIGGMYENKKDWKVGYIVDKTLVPATLTDTAGVPIKVLPDNYYTITPQNQVTIPKGSFNGLMLVQLTDAFLDDPAAVTGNYVIPLKIISSDADSILRGKPFVSNPNKLLASDWDPNSPPRDFVLFGIKYINPYDGAYFHRGKDVTLDGAGNPTATVTYHQQYVENDELWKLTTTGRTTVNASGVGANNGGTSAMTLDITADGNVQVKPVTTSAFKATGTGKYVTNAELWGGTKHPAFYLNYTYKNGTVNHAVTDTLVFRDNEVVYQQLLYKVN